MDIPNCQQYYLERYNRNVKIIKAINAKKVLMTTIGVILFVAATLSLFIKSFSFSPDTFTKLSSLLAGIYFVSSNLVSKPNLEEIGKENVGLKIILEDFEKFERLNRKEQMEIYNGCEELKKKLRTS